MSVKANQKQERERGAIAIVAAVLVTALIGLGAVAVDLGQIYAERAQLQNGADSAALAIAQECYKTQTCTNASSAVWQAWAQSLVNGNANDNATTIKSVTFSGSDPTYQVVVTTSTLDGTTGAGFLTPMFSKALNTAPVTVGAQATASMKLPSSGNAFPLALSDCRFDLSGSVATGAIQLVTYKPGNAPCTSVSGHTIPGGFGWLNEPNPSICAAPTDSNGIVGSNTGAAYPGGPCDAILNNWAAQINAGQTVEGTFPVFDDAGGTGANGWFHILGYATFEIIGWKFSGGNGLPSVFHNTLPYVGTAANQCTGNCRGIIGRFERFTSLDASTSGGTPGANLGSVVVTLVK
ncbi:pilus assembly protein TadG-related protein [Sinomonas sp. G460-2]|uniref:pilus assembly protein TadG-related protein n=1 Tax=Sinomonas sp. G460-2 TaxID=3393464 RepID=UPI0039EEB268